MVLDEAPRERRAHVIELLRPMRLLADQHEAAALPSGGDNCRALGPSKCHLRYSLLYA